jgi:hypothetical protein
MDAVRSSDRVAGNRARDAMMQMKIDIATIAAAVTGDSFAFECYGRAEPQALRDRQCSYDSG